MPMIHINLVSEQLVPNLIPVFADHDCVGVILVQGDKRLSEKANLLEKLYQARNIPVLWRSEGESSHRLDSLKAQAKALLDKLATHYPEATWVLNATCGTKPMSLAFTNAFNQYNAEQTAKSPQAIILYTDSQNREISVLNDNIHWTLPYFSALTLEELLAANGFFLSSAINRSNDFAVKKRARLTRFLLKFFTEHPDFPLGYLQSAAALAGQHYPANHHQELPACTPNNQMLFEQLEEAGIIKNRKNHHASFTSAEACWYMAGGWLEEATYLEAIECGFEEVAMNVEGRWGNQQTPTNKSLGKNNEFDVLIKHKNQLLTIECKAKNWERVGQGASASTNQDVLHKLENLSRKLGGAYGKTVLVSLNPLPEAMRQRAEDSRIQVCELEHQSNLGQFLDGCLSLLK